MRAGAGREAGSLDASGSRSEGLACAHERARARARTRVVGRHALTLALEQTGGESCGTVRLGPARDQPRDAYFLEGVGGAAMGCKARGT